MHSRSPHVVLRLAVAVAVSLTPCASAGAHVVPSHAIGVRPFSRAPATPLIYVADASTPAVTEYALDARGNAAPVRTIAGTHTLMGHGINGIAVDSTGVVYVSASAGGILAFAAGANGDVAPVRHITAATNGPIDAFELAVDASDDLYVANGNDVKVFAPGADGVAAPLRDIAGSKTTFSLVEGIAVDAEGRLYAVDFLGVDVVEFAPGATGNVAPIATIAGPKTTFAFPRYAGLTPEDGLFVSDETDVAQFAPGAQGDVAPRRVITFNGATGPYGNLAVAGDLAFVGTFGNAPAWALAEYRAGAGGGRKPLAVIAGGRTHLVEPVGVVVR